jgi:hypothetical protein
MLLLLLVRHVGELVMVLVLMAAVRVPGHAHQVAPTCKIKHGRLLLYHDLYFFALHYIY